MQDLSFKIPFNHAAEGMIVVNNTGEIIHVNQAAMRMFGYTLEELSGSNIDLLVPDSAKSKHAMNRESYAGNPHTRPMGKGMDLFAKKKDATEFPVEISLSPFQVEDENFVLAFIVDITEKKAADAKLEAYYSKLENEVKKRTLILSEAVLELEKTKSELHDALSKEKKLNDLKSRFVSMVSHEFRTPLATVLSSIDLAEQYLETGEKEKQKKHFSRVRTALHGLTAILNDVLSLGRLEEGRISVKPVKMNFREFISELTDELRGLTKEGQQITLAFDGEQGDVFADKNILRQICSNLISNAIKFSPENSVVEVSASQRNNLMVLRVKDQGIGISEEDQKSLFKSFFRGQNATNIQGTGLGLNIVFKYIQLLDGDISFESNLNEGSEFVIEIPSATEGVEEPE